MTISIFPKFLNKLTLKLPLSLKNKVFNGHTHIWTTPTSKTAPLDKSSSFCLILEKLM